MTCPQEGQAPLILLGVLSSQVDPAAGLLTSLSQPSILVVGDEGTWGQHKVGYRASDCSIVSV